MLVGVASQRSQATLMGSAGDLTQQDRVESSNKKMVRNGSSDVQQWATEHTRTLHIDTAVAAVNKRKSRVSRLTGQAVNMMLACSRGVVSVARSFRLLHRGIPNISTRGKRCAKTCRHRANTGPQQQPIARPNGTHVADRLAIPQMHRNGFKQM